jgi:hypothetical protein
MDGPWRDVNIIPRYNAAGVRKFAFHMPDGMPMIGEPRPRRRLDGFRPVTSAAARTPLTGLRATLTDLRAGRRHDVPGSAEGVDSLTGLVACRLVGDEPVERVTGVCHLGGAIRSRDRAQQ